MHANVRFLKYLELKNNRQIYYLTIKIAPMHKYIVQKQIDVKLKARIITPAHLAWSFPEVVDTKGRRKGKNYTNYRVLSGRMKAK